MSKTLRTVAVIAGAVAIVAATGGAALAALAPAGMAGTATVAGISAATLSTVASVASAVGFAASIGVAATAKTPPARGSVSETIIAAEPPSPYIMGRTYSGGVLRHDVGYGATLKKVPNPYRAQVLVHSVAGPLAALVGIYADYAEVPFAGNAAAGYYNGFLYRDVRYGQVPDSALSPNFAGAPNWTSAHKLSGKAAILLNGKFDKDGKRFASGWPVMGAIWQGVATYDARKDSTYPGGSGSHRINDEATWEYSECPAQHALAYALGRFRNGKKVFGVGLPVDGIVLEHFVELSNVCQANGWKIGGIAYEPGDRWANLKRILAAGGAEPLFIGGKLGLRINAPRVSIYDLTAGDLAEDDAEIPAAKTWRERRNGIRPKYRSEANRWTYVASDLVSVSSYIAEDGEEKFEELQWDFVQDKNQAAQLAAYKLVNGREIGPITLVCKPHMRRFGPGDMITLNLGADHALGGLDAIILKRSVDPSTMKVTLTLETETAGKHDFALGRTGTAPPTPGLVAKEDRDIIARSVLDTDTIPWTGVLDDDPAHPRPEDGATVGATPEQVSLLDQLQADTAAAQSAIAQAQADIAEITGAVEGDFGPLMQAVNDLENEVDAVQGNIISLQSATSAVQQSVNGLQTGLSGAQGSIADLQVQAGQIVASIGQVGTEVDQIEATVSTQGGYITTLQQSVTGLGGSVSTLSQTVATQGSSISSLASTVSSQGGTLATLQTQVMAGGGNIAPNSPFAASTYGWNTYAPDNTSLVWGRDIAGDEWRPTNEHNIGIFQSDNVTTRYAQWHSDQIAIKANAWYEFSGYLAAHRCQAYMRIDWIDANGSGIRSDYNISPHVGDAGGDPNGGPNINNWKVCWNKVQSPSNATRAHLVFVKDGTLSGHVNSYAWMCRPMLREVTAQYQGPSSYTPSSSAASIDIQAQALSTLSGSFASLETRVSTAEGSVTSLSQSLTNANGSISSLQQSVSSLNGSVSTLQQSSTTQAGQIATLQQTVSTQGASITTNAQAITTTQGNLATLTNTVSASSNPNVLPNGGFENGTAGWAGNGNAGAPVNGWFQAVNAAWGSYAANSTPWTGSSSLQFATLTSGIISGIDVGSFYTLAADADIRANQPGAQAWLQLVWQTPSGSQYSDCPHRLVGGGFGFDDVGYGRSLFKGTGQVPAGATGVQVSLVVYAPPGVTITGMAWRQVKLERGTIATPYSGEASARQAYQAYADLNSSFASLSTTVSSQGGSITTLQSSYTNLNGTVNTLSSTVSSQGVSITNLQSTQSTQSGQIATLQTQVTAGGGNLLQNTDLAVDTSGWSFQSNAGLVSYGDRVGAGGAWVLSDENALRIGQDNGGTSGYADWTQNLSVQENLWYDISCRVAAHRCSVEVIIQWRDANFNVLSADSAGAVNSPAVGGNALHAWYWYGFKKQAPAGAARATFYLRKYPTNSGQANSYAWFCRPQVAETRASSASPIAYSPGSARASISVQAQAISTVQGQYASLSSTVSANTATISQNATAISTLQGDVATLNTRVSAGAPNLLRYGGFQQGLYGWNTNGPWGQSSTSDPNWGPFVYVAASGGNYYANTTIQPVQANGFYTISADIDRGSTVGGYVAARIVWTFSGSPDAVGAACIAPDGRQFTNVTSQRLTATAQAPGNATGMYCQLVSEGSSGGNNHFRLIKINAGTVAAPFSSEAAIVQTFETLSTLNTQYASLTSTVSTQGVTISTQSTAITTLNGNVSTLFGQWVLDVQVGGIVAGMKLANNGSATSLKFRADLVEFVGSTSTARSEFRGGTWFGYDDQARKRYQIGNQALT